jgi:hypothetical protein
LELYYTIDFFHPRKKIFENFFSENDTSRDKKTCGKTEFDIYEAKKCFPDSGKICIEEKSRKNGISRLFRFNAQAFPESEKCFSNRKCQIQIPRMFLPLEVSFPEKHFRTFFTWIAPYCV